MNYFEITITLDSSEEAKDIICAELADIGFESFSVSEYAVNAYITENNFDESMLLEVIERYRNDFGMQYSKRKIKEENWNEIWEKQYEPVVIDERVLVKAPFHQIDKTYPIEVIIEPKMSFGTAHHETTELMIKQLLKLNLQGKSVLDMGCGTAILAIVAAKLGAKDVLAVDNDHWAYENSIENIHKNNFENISVLMGEADIIADFNFDIILANINKNVLLKDIPQYAKVTNHLGMLIISGFYKDDLTDLINISRVVGYEHQNTLLKNDWVSASFIKIH